MFVYQRNPVANGRDRSYGLVCEPTLPQFMPVFARFRRLNFPRNDFPFSYWLLQTEGEGRLDGTRVSKRASFLNRVYLFNPLRRKYDI